MPDYSPPSPAIVVGIDGSPGSVEAALWAIDEAVDRDLPLRLLYAIEPSNSTVSNSHSMAQAFVIAEASVRYASMAVESADRPVKIEIEILHGRCVDLLVAASRSAAIICIGALGVDAAGDGRMGSTPSALVARAHCPVAIVRRSASPRQETGWVAAVVDGSADAPTVLDHAVQEARVRAASLRVLLDAKANLEGYLASWHTRYPELDIQAVTVPTGPLDYLARHIDSIGLIVLGRQPSEELSALMSHPATNGLECSALVCGRRCAP